jgi:hypothetical protein
MKSGLVDQFISMWNNGELSHEEIKDFCLEACKTSPKEIIYDRIDRNQPYLVRWDIKKSDEECLYVHRFLCSDFSVPHDHPWDFKSRILEGSYSHSKWVPDRTTGLLEEVREVRREGDEEELLATDVHRIIIDKVRDLTEIDDAPLTVCLMKRKKRVWGFIKPSPNGFSWEAYHSFLEKDPTYTVKED